MTATKQWQMSKLKFQMPNQIQRPNAKCFELWALTFLWHWDFELCHYFCLDEILRWVLVRSKWPLGRPAARLNSVYWLLYSVCWFLFFILSLLFHFRHFGHFRHFFCFGFSWFSTLDTLVHFRHFRHFFSQGGFNGQTQESWTQKGDWPSAQAQKREIEREGKRTGST